MGDQDARREWLKCQASASYFIHNYVNIYDATEGKWIPFHLWKEQFQVVKLVSENKLSLVLKARQLGLTWLVVAYALWDMLFHPVKTVLLFSRRDDEAIYLLKRLTDMYDHLPDWCKVRKVVTDSSHQWELSTGSIAYGFPTTAGDSYTASLAIVDEADLVPDLDRLLNAVKPTIDGGGKMIMITRSNKEEPNSTFKRMYRAARAGASPWKCIFLPWWTRPERTQEWYEDQKMDSLTRTGSLDDLYQQYPGTDVEALSAKTLDKRLPPEWLANNYFAAENLKVYEGEERPPAINGLLVYAEPQRRHKYCLGADPAEGNPTSDDSSLHVVDALTGEEVASFAARVEPAVFGSYIAEISRYYANKFLGSRCPVMVERNNHGHAVLLWLKDNAPDVEILAGPDGRVGWQETSKSKALLYSLFADTLREDLTKIHTFDTFMQLQSVEGATLKAPEGEYDDRAVSFSLAVVGSTYEPTKNFRMSYTHDRTDTSTHKVRSRVGNRARTSEGRYPRSKLP